MTDNAEKVKELPEFFVPKKGKSQDAAAPQDTDIVSFVVPENRKLNSLSKYGGWLFLLVHVVFREKTWRTRPQSLPTAG